MGPEDLADLLSRLAKLVPPSEHPDLLVPRTLELELLVVGGVITASAGKASASAETSGSAWRGCMETSVGWSIHGSIGLHPR